MSQPESAAPQDGANALLAAAETGSGPRRQRYVPKAKDAARKEAPRSGSEAAAATPEPAPATKDAEQPSPPAQAAAQAPPQAQAEPAPRAAEPAQAEPSQAEPPPAEPPSSNAEVAFPSKPLAFESVFGKKKTPDMDPEMFAMIQQRQVKLLKSIASIVNMFNERFGEYQRSVASAVAAGFPKDELAKLAITFDCGPFLESVIGEMPDADR